ncbi:hypothetical protein WN944_012208 [Citrus x changshan-huyou]|uniref:Alpha-galactosidase n=1 Tax=Citrus x changshan-huyou TaxID=2935761 RepID=A0AAP0N1B6_9ROSI
MKMGFAVVGSVFVVLAILRIVSTLTNAINISTNARQRLHPVSSSQWPRSDSSHGAHEALVSTGLAALGYKYVNIDKPFKLIMHSEKAFSCYSHLNFERPKQMIAGQKVSETGGFRTCSNTMPGSLGHELQDEGTFAQWGIDYLKYDNCFHDGSKPQERYTKMSYALLKAGRPILYSIWGTKIQRNGLVRNAWRTTGDIRDKWESITSIADQNNVWGRFAGPGRWNGPLLIGYDIRSASGETLKILGNKEVIVVNQDPLGVPRRKIRSKGALEQIFKAQPIIFSRQYADLGKAAIKRKNCGSFLLHGEKLEFLYQLRLLSETCGGQRSWAHGLSLELDTLAFFLFMDIEYQFEDEVNRIKTKTRGRGPSGRGKTTLPTTLGGRLSTGETRGNIDYNNNPLSRTVKRKTGFVAHSNVFYLHLTVTETLVFIALFRLPIVSPTRRKCYRLRQ